MIIASFLYPRKAFWRWQGIIIPDARVMQYVWPYLSIWNTLNQSRYTVLWQHGQCGPRSRTLSLCSKKTADVTRSVEPRCVVRLRLARGSTLQGCTLNTKLQGIDGHTGNQHRPPVSSFPLIFTLGPLPSYDSVPKEQEGTRNRKSFYLRQASVITGGTD